MENQIQTVENITRIEYHGQPVLTTEQLATELSKKGDRTVTVDNLKMNFHNNIERFVEGKHFFKLEGNELTSFKDMVKNFYYVPKNTARLFLWTKRGCARHCKMVNTDTAWDVFEALEDNYFNRPAVKQPDLLAPFADFVALERDKFNHANSEESKMIAKAQLLRELASASKDDDIRNELVLHAAKLLIGEDFVINRRRVIK